MDRQHMFKAFDLKDQNLLDDQVQPVTAVQFHALVLDRKRNLPLESDSSQMKFVAKTFLVGGFQQTRPERAMHLDRGSDHTLSELLMK
jgi:hypothetical protein